MRVPLFSVARWCRDTGHSADTIGESGIGTGPFQLETLNVEGTTVLSANDDYWGGTPGVAGVELPALPDSEARVLALQSGQVDLVLDVTMAQTELLAGNDGYTVLRYPSGTWSALVMRTDTPPFDGRARAPSHEDGSRSASARRSGPEWRGHDLL
ncbi:MAG TPA: ABC transporter substrate-binding protein [Caldilineaceae bacterium]|nr:ABC transporter substrate-binding protein [Caldilineaceae bacterium]